MITKTDTERTPEIEPDAWDLERAVDTVAKSGLQHPAKKPIEAASSKT
jgi:hypothetical protein